MSKDYSSPRRSSNFPSDWNTSQSSFNPSSCSTPRKSPNANPVTCLYSNAKAQQQPVIQSPQNPQRFNFTNDYSRPASSPPSPQSQPQSCFRSSPGGPSACSTRTAESYYNNNNVPSPPVRPQTFSSQPQQYQYSRPRAQAQTQPLGQSQLNSTFGTMRSSDSQMPNSYQDLNTSYQKYQSSPQRQQQQQQQQQQQSPKMITKTSTPGNLRKLTFGEANEDPNVIYEENNANYYNAAAHQPLPQQTVPCAGSRPGPNTMWNQLEDDYESKMHNLYAQQADERQYYPADQQNVLRERHSIEQGEMDVLYQKNRFKMLHKLQNNLDRSVTDEEVFGSIFGIGGASEVDVSNIPHPQQSPRIVNQTGRHYQNYDQNQTMRSQPAINRSQIDEYPSSFPYRNGYDNINMDTTHQVTSYYPMNNQAYGNHSQMAQVAPQIPCRNDTCYSQSHNSKKSAKLYDDFVNSTKKMIITVLALRRRMRSAIEESIGEATGRVDCREKRLQQKALSQLEVNLQEEVIVIYQLLMQKIKELENAQKQGSFTSVVSINVGDKKLLPTEALTSMDLNDLDQNEKAIGDQFALIILDTITELSSRIDSLDDEYDKVAQSNIDRKSLVAFQKELHKMHEQIEEDFIGVWTDFEAQSIDHYMASNALVDDQSDACNSVRIEMGNALQEILAKQYKMTDELAKRHREECTECYKNGQHEAPQAADREEQSAIFIDISNDFWVAMERAKRIIQAKSTTSSTSCNNNGPIFRAILAIYRKCNGLVRILIEGHSQKRRSHQVENLTSIFHEEWSRLRQDIKSELDEIISSLHYQSNTSMTCQEKRLKLAQDDERNVLMDRYKKQFAKHPCQADEFENIKNRELEQLGRSHLEQWNQLVQSKIQCKIEEIDKIYPKESKVACVQTCFRKRQEQDDLLEELPESPGPEATSDWKEKCHCKPKDASGATRSGSDDEQKNCKCGKEKCKGRDKTAEQANFGGDLSDIDVIDMKELLDEELCDNENCKRREKSPEMPKLGDLTDIEVLEMKELQKNLRQWQLARRNLLESINHGLDKQ